MVVPERLANPGQSEIEDRMAVAGKGVSPVVEQARQNPGERRLF